MYVTIFKDSFDKLNPIIITLDMALERIRNGQKSGALINQIRTSTPDQQRHLKRQLPSIVFSGQCTLKVWVKKTDLNRYPEGGYYSMRTNESVTTHSGVFVLDFDHIADPVAWREQLKQDEYIYSAWVSPTGTGVKALVRINPNIDAHSDLYTGFLTRYPQLDKTSRNIARLCFESYDPDLWINPNSKIWNSIVKEKNAQPKPIHKGKVNNWNKVNRMLNKIAMAADGEKHETLRNVSRLFGGWIAAGEIDEGKAVELLRYEISKRDVKDLGAAHQTIDDGIAHAKQSPITQWNEKKMEKRLYKSMADVFDKVVDFYLNGYPKGKTWGWKCSEEFGSFLLGATTYFYSQPYSGKSQLINEIAVNVCIYNDWYCAISSPETGEIHQIYGELISIYVGRSFTGDYKMSREVMEEAANWVAKHFIVIDATGEDEFYIKDYFNQVQAIEREYQIKISLTIIDPLNSMDIDMRNLKREDKAIAKDLDLCLHDARQFRRHNVLVTHVRDQKQFTNKDGQNYYPPPSFRDIADGQVFSRKGMQMVAVYRPMDVLNKPLLDENGVPYPENTTLIFVQKSKPKGIGKTGMFKLFYDFQRNQYYEIDGPTTRYSRKTKYESIEEIITDVKPDEPMALGEITDSPF
jgi:hypothetical protein